MSQLMFARFESEHRKANEVYKLLRAMSKSKQVKGIQGAVIVCRSLNDRISLGMSSGWRTSEETGWGNFWGLIVGVIFSKAGWDLTLGVVENPIMSHDRNVAALIDHSFVPTVCEVFAPGDSGIFLLIERSSVKTVAEELERRGAVVYIDEIELDDEMIRALKGSHEFR